MSRGVFINELNFDIIGRKPKIKYSAIKLEIKRANHLIVKNLKVNKVI